MKTTGTKKGTKKTAGWQKFEVEVAAGTAVTMSVQQQRAVIDIVVSRGAMRLGHLLAAELASRIDAVAQFPGRIPHAPPTVAATWTGCSVMLEGVHDFSEPEIASVKEAIETVTGIAVA